MLRATLSRARPVGRGLRPDAAPASLRGLASKGASGKEPVAESWFSMPSNVDKLTHVVLSGFALWLSMKLTSQAHKAEDAQALLQAQLVDARDMELRRRRAMLEQEPELARQAGLRADGVKKFTASLTALDAQLATEVGAQTTSDGIAHSEPCSA